MGNDTAAGRRFRRPLPPTGRAEERCNVLYRQFLHMMDEAERELNVMERRLKDAEDEIKALKDEKG